MPSEDSQLHLSVQVPSRGSDKQVAWMQAVGQTKTVMDAGQTQSSAIIQLLPLVANEMQAQYQHVFFLFLLFKETEESYV